MPVAPRVVVPGSAARSGDALRPAHAIWLMRRASMLVGLAGVSGGGPLDPSRGELFRQLAAKVWGALESGQPLALAPEELGALERDAERLSERAASELRRDGARDLERGEEWCRIARALRDVAAAGALRG